MVVPEEFTEEVPMGVKAFAKDRIARWTYTSSSESSDEEPPTLTPKDLAHRGMRLSLTLHLISSFYFAD